jgi:hypothetical protein
MLKWTAGLAVAGVVGMGAGYGADELLRSTIPPQVVTKTESVLRRPTIRNYLSTMKSTGLTCSNQSAPTNPFS